MPGFKLIKCNFLESLERLKYPLDLAKKEISYEKNIHAIFLDIGRISGFFPTNGITFNDFVATWLKRKKVPATFIQGIFDASFYTLTQHFFFNNLNKLQNIYPLDPELQRVAMLGEAERIPYYIQNRSELALCYLDDQAMPCGVLISSLKTIPSLWIAAVIHDTTADLAEKKVSVFFHEHLCDVEEGKFQAINSTAAREGFLNSLGSLELQNVLKLCFNDEASINTQTLEELKPRWCALVKMLAIPSIDDLKNTIINQYIISGEDLWYFDCPNNTLEKLTFLKEKSLSSLLMELKFDINRTATKEDLRLIASYTTGHTQQRCLALINPDDTIIQKKNKQYHKLKQIQLERITREKKCCKEEMLKIEPRLAQPFLKRNSLSLSVGTISLLFVVGIVLTLSGIFAPIGLTLIGGLAALAVALALLGGIVFIVCAGAILIREEHISSCKSSLFSEYYERTQLAQHNFEKNCQEAMTAEYDLCLMENLPTDLRDYLYSYILIDNILHYIDIEEGNTTPVIKKRTLTNLEIDELQNKLLRKTPQDHSDCQIYYLSLEDMKFLGFIDEGNSLQVADRRNNFQQQKRLLESLIAPPTNGITTTAKRSDSESPTSNSQTPRSDTQPDTQQEHSASHSHPSSSTPDGTSSSHDENSGSTNEYSSGEDSEDSTNSYAMGSVL
jgi:hypothetical protein